MADTKRLSDIARAMHAALAPMLSADLARDAANEDLTAAKGEAVNAREGIMGVLAGAAAAGAWSAKEIEAAAKMAGQLGTNAETPKAVATFLGEAKRAMHPDVREEFADIVAVRNEAWDGEQGAKALDKDTATPIKKAFQRKYHLLVTLLGEAGEGRFYTTADEVRAFAVSRDPDHDPEKVARRLEKIREQLEAFVVDFPVQDITDCVEFLRAIGEEELVAARHAKLGSTPAPKPEKPTRPAKPAPVKPVATVVAAAEVEPAQGASELLDDVLNDFDGARAAA